MFHTNIWTEGRLVNSASSTVDDNVYDSRFYIPGLRKTIMVHFDDYHEPCLAKYISLSNLFVNIVKKQTHS